MRKSASARVFNITLHGVGKPTRHLERGEEDVWLSLPSLEKVLDDARGRSDLRITVDDGNRSDAHELLLELGLRELTATFFLVAGRIDRRDFLTAEDVKAIVLAGHSLGSHGMTHRPWRGLDRETLDEELSTAREILEAVGGKPVTKLSCPFGSYDRGVLQRARELGYERIFTSDGGPADPGAWLQPRTTISSLGRPSLDDIVCTSRRSLLAKQAKRVVKRWR